MNNANFTVNVAGNGTLENHSRLLNYPAGIFFDDHFNLCVADSPNNRIQRFTFGSLTGTTVAGTGLMGSLSLSAPYGVTLDGDGYIFVADAGKSRIIGSGPRGFRSIIGCEGSGSAAHQLNTPLSISFDSVGNLYVTDWLNCRIQKFLLTTNSCGEFRRISLIRELHTVDYRCAVQSGAIFGLCRMGDQCNDICR